MATIVWTRGPGGGVLGVLRSLLLAARDCLTWYSKAATSARCCCGSSWSAVWCSASRREAEEAGVSGYSFWAAPSGGPRLHGVATSSFKSAAAPSADAPLPLPFFHPLLFFSRGGQGQHPQGRRRTGSCGWGLASYRAWIGFQGEGWMAGSDLGRRGAHPWLPAL